MYLPFYVAQDTAESVPLDSSDYEIFTDHFLAMETPTRVEWTPTSTYDATTAVECKPLTGTTTEMTFNLPYGKTGGYFWYFDEAEQMSNGIANV